MSIVFCGVCPHPPIAVPEVGGREADIVSSTRRAFLEFGRRVKESGAETVVIISPHAPLFRDVVGINYTPVLKGDLAAFRAWQVRFELENDFALADEIKKQAEGLGFTVVKLDEQTAKQYQLTLKLDHGVTVPLYFLREAGVTLPLVHVSMMVAPPDRLYLFGPAVRLAAESLGRKTALVASADLSHGLTHDAPGGYLPRGKEFDREIARLLAGPDAEGVIGMDPLLVKQAGECGYRSIVMMLGALDGYDVEAQVLSYEGPFGVGYLVATYLPGDKNPKRSVLKENKTKQVERIALRRSRESYLVKVARETLENHVKGIPPPGIGEVPEEFKGKAGVFVSIKKHGNLRGCIGTIEPTKTDTVKEVISNAVSAGVRDPRFEPVIEEELDDLEYSVDVLQPVEPVRSLKHLDPKKYGVVVRAGRRSGLLLPNLEGIDTAEEQVAIARRKAGIGMGEPVELERFEVMRYE